MNEKMGPILIYCLLALVGWSLGGFLGVLAGLSLALVIQWFFIKGEAPRQKFRDRLGSSVGQTLGLLFLGVIGFGVLSALLSPGSCSSGGYDQEYRAP